MKNGSNLLFSLFLLVLIGIIYREWFFSKEIIGGDWPYFYKEGIKNLSIFPPSWSGVHGNGFGGKIVSYNIDSYLYFSSFLGTKILGLSWEYTYKIFWFFAFLVVGFISSYLLGKKVLGENIYAIVTSLIYTSNTYILMVIGGGQMGFGLSYAITPAVVLNGMELISKLNLRRAVFLGVLLGMQLLFDVRIFYMTSFVIGLFFLYQLLQTAKKERIKFIFRFSSYLIVSLFVLISINLFWILPLVFYPFNPLDALGQSYTSIDSLRFFSFADLPTTMSFIHPNWPSNIFGKISFLRPEFLILPLLAFLCLLIAKKGAFKNYILFFISLALVGIFLSKGTNEPFGEIYVFLFNNIPGFKMFRDPTKWYLLTAISYSLLIPMALMFISKMKFIKNMKLVKVIPILFLIFWTFSIREAVLGQLKGTFESKKVPSEYIEFKDKLVRDEIFYRTLWIPRQQRFTFTSETHPSVEVAPLFNATNTAELKSEFDSIETPNYLKRLAIKYIVIPYDTQGEIFVDDGKFDERKRAETEKMLDSAKWLKKIRDDKLTIYEVYSYDSLFEIEKGEINSYLRIAPYEYKINYTSSTNTNIVFAQNFNSYWRAIINEKQILPTKTEDNLMNFKIPKVEKGQLSIEFIQESIYRLGWLLTIFSTILISIFYMLQSERFKNK